MVVSAALCAQTCHEKCSALYLSCANAAGVTSTATLDDCFGWNKNCTAKCKGKRNIIRFKYLRNWDNTEY